MRREHTGLAFGMEDGAVHIRLLYAAHMSFVRYRVAKLSVPSTTMRVGADEIQRVLELECALWITTSGSSD